MAGWGVTQDDEIWRAQRDEVLRAAALDLASGEGPGRALADQPLRQLLAADGYPRHVFDEVGDGGVVGVGLAGVHQ